MNTQKKMRVRSLLATLATAFFTVLAMAATPLTAVAGEIEHAIGACSFRQAPHRTEVIPSCAEMRPGAIGRIIAPGKSSPVCAARRFLPFRFGRQSFARACAVNDGACPWDFDYGVMLVARIRAPALARSRKR